MKEKDILNLISICKEMFPVGSSVSNENLYKHSKEIFQITKESIYRYDTISNDVIVDGVMIGGIFCKSSAYTLLNNLGEFAIRILTDREKIMEYLESNEF